MMMMMYWEGCFKGRTQIYYPIPKGGNVTIECLPRVIQHAKGGDCGGWGASCDCLFLTCVWDAVVKPEMSPAKCPYGV